jgi:hypothetical protein
VPIVLKSGSLSLLEPPGPVQASHGIALPSRNIKVSFDLTECTPFRHKKNREEMMVVAKQYPALWNFPHSLGAIDGKHAVLQYQRKSASEYFNYKNTFSIVLFFFCRC